MRTLRTAIVIAVIALSAVFTGPAKAQVQIHHSEDIKLYVNLATVGTLQTPRPEERVQCPGRRAAEPDQRNADRPRRSRLHRQVRQERGNRDVIRPLSCKPQSSLDYVREPGIPHRPGHPGESQWPAEVPSRFRFRAELPLRMTDFAITPLIALFGAVKARDELKVRFGLTLEMAGRGSQP